MGAVMGGGIGNLVASDVATSWDGVRCHQTHLRRRNAVFSPKPLRSSFSELSLSYGKVVQAVGPANDRTSAVRN